MTPLKSRRNQQRGWLAEIASGSWAAIILAVAFGKFPLRNNRPLKKKRGAPLPDAPASLSQATFSVPAVVPHDLSGLKRKTDWLSNVTHNDGMSHDTSERVRRSSGGVVRVSRSRPHLERHHGAGTGIDRRHDHASFRHPSNRRLSWKPICGPEGPKISILATVPSDRN